MLVCKLSRKISLVTLIVGLSSASRAHAHFVLRSPASTYEQSALGDPQKAAPCGDNGTATATGEITHLHPGETVTVTIDETIFHPGHYRIAIAVDDIANLPPEPIVTADNVSPCGSAEIQDPPVFPVLADGVFAHTSPFSGPQSIDITLPTDLSCTECTLQVIQFMSDHALNNPGGCYYHHCATLAVEGDVQATTGEGGTATASGEGGATTEEATTGDTAETTGPSGTTGSASGTATTDSTITSDTIDTASSSASAEDSDSGCSCQLSRPDQGVAPNSWALLLLGLGVVRRRRPAA